jgi:ribA/ribD-fused uncharacterized protein
VTLIPSFTGIHEFLSNGHEGAPFPIIAMVEREYLTGEHAYQAMKATTWDDHDFVRMALKPFGPDGAKKRGRSIRCWPDWEARKYDAMRVVLDYKFATGSEMARRLLDTGDAELVEGNDWGDTCWGVSGGQGRNWLGTLLMARRAVLRSRI